MNKEEDYASDSDKSDEDFCPNGEQSDLGSEEESEDISEDEKNENGDQLKETKSNKRQRKPRGKRQSKKNKCQEEAEGEKTEVSSRRQTRRGEDVESKKIIEKDEIESDEEDKGRSDSLWADFLSDVKVPPPKPSDRTKDSDSSSSKPKVTPSSCEKNVTTNGCTKKITNGGSPSEAKKEESSPKLVTVTEVVDFAGEEVSIQKTVKADSIKENKAAPSKPSQSIPVPASLKRPAVGGGGGGGGLGSLLSQIGKKKKISVLEKSKLDWNSFKQTEGIEEELQSFNKGKDGYLERQDFLQRTDLRQFEIEKSLRQTKRN